MNAFFGYEERKKDLLERLRSHRESGNLIKGTTWNGEKGCAIGCMFNEYNHSLVREDLRS